VWNPGSTARAALPIPVFAATRGSAVKLQSAVRSAGIIALPATVADSNPNPRASIA